MEPYVPVIIGILYSAFAVLIHLLSFRFIRKASKTVLLPIDQTDNLQEGILKKSSGIKKAETLIEQYNISSRLKFYYRNLAIAYYENYYVFTICSIVYTIFMAITIFLVAGDGWTNADISIKVLALMTIFFASCYYFLPNVMNNKLNLKKNMDGVKIFQKIQFDILSFLSRIDTAEQDEINTFIANIYNSIKNNYDYNINLDTTLLDKNPLDNFKGLKPK